MYLRVVVCVYIPSVCKYRQWPPSVVWTALVVVVVLLLVVVVVARWCHVTSVRRLSADGDISPGRRGGGSGWSVVAVVVAGGGGVAALTPEVAVASSPG